MKKLFFHITKYLMLLLSGVCIGLFLSSGISLWRDKTDVRMKDDTLLNAETVVDYPFSGNEKEWSLILQESSGQDVMEKASERNFCLYDENGQLLQVFSLDIGAEELIFRFDSLFDYYKDLTVFPAEAQETGANGLCYQWENERQRFAEEPVSIPWYQEGSVRERAFLVSDVGESGETKAICRIHEGSRSVVKLRKWELCRDAETGEENLCIQDCLEQQDIYLGKVKRYETGALINEKYYQYLFWDGLKSFWSQENDGPIWMQKAAQGRGLVEVEYEDKIDFLADYGFAQTEPFYEYYDRFHNLIMEFYFDPQAGRGCGICYHYFYNDNLEKRASREGFAFDEVKTEIWKPQDTFSALPVSGEDASAYAPGYREIYEYTDDGGLSSFEARGMVMREQEPVEVSLLSADYIYRNDGTLCHKQYHHWPMIFGSTGQAQSGDYDEQGRLVFWYGYITHGAMEEYYIYEESSMEPEYCLSLDWGGAYVEMTAFDKDT